jgi:hypothetical protein
MKFCQNPSNGSRAETCGCTDTMSYRISVHAHRGKGVLTIRRCPENIGTMYSWGGGGGLCKTAIRWVRKYWFENSICE